MGTSHRRHRPRRHRRASAGPAHGLCPLRRKGSRPQNQIEGKLEKGQKVVVVEDLISTGGSVIEVVNVLREAGAEVLGIVSIFTYGMQKGLDRLAEANVKNISLTNFDAIAAGRRRRGLYPQRGYRPADRFPQQSLATKAGSEATNENETSDRHSGPFRRGNRRADRHGGGHHRQSQANTPKAARGKKLATLFFEPSTRTRLSFEAAMLRAGRQRTGLFRGQPAPPPPRAKAWPIPCAS